MRRIMHMCLSVRGALRWDRGMKRRMASSITVDGRRLQSADEVQDFLMDCLASGKEVLPMADCEGFDFKTGCPGHEVAEDGP